MAVWPIGQGWVTILPEVQAPIVVSGIIPLVMDERLLQRLGAGVVAVGIATHQPHLAGNVGVEEAVSRSSIFVFAAMDDEVDLLGRVIEANGEVSAVLIEAREGAGFCPCGQFIGVNAIAPNV